MKKVIEKVVALVYGAEIHANHTAIKGRKSSGKEDSFSNDKNWKSLSNDNN